MEKQKRLSDKITSEVEVLESSLPEAKLVRHFMDARGLIREEIIIKRTLLKRF